MSFLYPRRVSILRPNSTKATAVGDVGYNADRGATDDTVIAECLPANIEFDRKGQRNPMGLPTDAVDQPTWRIFIPRRAAALGTIQSRDIVVDDLGQRYQIAGPPYWNSLGYQLRALSLEV